MYREAGARRCAYFNPEYLYSVLERGLVQLFFLSSKNWASPRTRLSPRKCMVENWWSLTIEVATDAKRCVELLNMFSKNLSSKLVTKITNMKT